MAHDTFQIGDLTAVIGDNAEHTDDAGKHRAGYNGLWSLQHRTGTRSLFVPGIAGLNLEHIVSGEGEDERDVFFEPRRAPMTFQTRFQLCRGASSTSHAHVFSRKHDPIYIKGTAQYRHDLQMPSNSACFSPRLHRAFLGQLYQCTE